MQIGFIGLGKMGKNMVLRLLEQGIEVVAWNRSPEPLKEVTQAGAVQAVSIEDLVGKLNHPKIIWLMLPAGKVVGQFVDQLARLLGQTDLVIDGGNSFYKDSIRRASNLAERGVHFMDIGVSGGPKGARLGACLMVGGGKQDYQLALPIIKAAAAEDAYGYFGPVGAGHFAKMIHNGIEYGMMESIAEGFAVLVSSPFKFNLREVARVYNNRSVIESRLMGWLDEALAEDATLSETSSVIGHTGEGEWTIKEAQELGVETPVLEKSFQIRVESEKIKENSPQGFRNRVVSALRGKFGGHAVKKS